VRALVTGGGGQLSSELAALLDAPAPSRAELDVRDDAAVARAIAEHRPEVVFNCAAYHNVELCETNEDEAWATNVRAVKRLAEACARADARLVHLSTNYVFDGSAAEPYGEHELPAPRSVYAITKLAGEHAALAYDPHALVVRSAGLYGLHGSRSKGGNFVQRMLARAREQGALKVVADQRLQPTNTADLAAAIVDAVRDGERGVLHLTNAGDCSWHAFTVEIMRLAGIDVPVEPATTSRPPGGADRPLNGVLASRRPALRPWDEALADYMGRAGLLGA
jgi:dTDP-4-dehydrorhamnose reductase